jgi:tetratricopeptide (TPR) repeat protein
LDASAEAEQIRHKHATYFVQFAERVEPHLQGSQPARWLQLLEQEHDNLRTALRWSVTNDADSAVRLATGIRYFWNYQGYLSEGLQWCEAALKLDQNVPAKTRWKLLSMAGNLARFQGDYDSAKRMYGIGLKEGRDANDLSQVSLSYRGLAGVALEEADYNAAREFMEAALAAARQADDRFGIARSLNMLGDLARTLGDDAGARPLLEQALSICRLVGNQYAIGNVLNNLAAAEYGTGDHANAELHFGEALSMAQEPEDRIVGDKIAISYALDGFAALAVSRNDPERAATLAGAAEQLRKSINYNIEPAERRFRETYLNTSRRMLSEEDFSSAYRKGRRLDLDEAIALARIVN